MPHHPAEWAEIFVLRFGGFFVAWLLGCFALGAVATVVGDLDRAEEEVFLRDSHQLAREHFWEICLVALITLGAFVAGIFVMEMVVFAIFKVIGWGYFGRFGFASSLVVYVVVASIVSWFGAAIPLVLCGSNSVRSAMKMSLEASAGYPGFLLLLVIESLVGSYVAWYAAHYFLQLVLPSSVQYSMWYGWIALFVSALASAAVQPPMFIGFSLLAEKSARDITEARIGSSNL